MSPLRGVALFEVGIALRAILAASKVGAWLRRALLWWSARRSLVPTREQSSREAARLARSANPTRCKVKEGPGTGIIAIGRMLLGERTRRSRAPTRGRAIPYPPNANRYPPRLARSANPTKRQLGQHAVLPLPFRNLIQLGDGGLGGLTLGGCGAVIVNIINPSSG